MDRRLSLYLDQSLTLSISSLSWCHIVQASVCGLVPSALAILLLGLRLAFYIFFIGVRVKPPSHRRTATRRLQSF